MTWKQAANIASQIMKKAFLSALSATDRPMLVIGRDMISTLVPYVNLKRRKLNEYFYYASGC